MANMYDDDFKDKPYVPPMGPQAPVAAPQQAAPANLYDPDFGGATVPGRPKPERAPEELRSADYSWRQAAGNKAQDALIALGATPYSAGHVGRGLVDVASLFPPVGATLSALDLGRAATSEQPLGQKLLSSGVEALGVVPGAKAAVRAKQGMPTTLGAPGVKAFSPAETELKSSSDQVYDLWRNSPVKYSPGMMDDATNSIALALTKSGSNPVKHGSVWAGLDQGRSLKKQTGMTNDDFETLRQQFSNVPPQEGRAASVARNTLENYLQNPPAQHIRSGSPVDIALDQQLIKTGRGNVAARKRSEVISEIENAAEVKGANKKDVDRFISNKLEALQTTKAGGRKTVGFNEDEAQQVRDAMAGSLLGNAAARTGKGLTSYLGAGSAGVGAGVGAGLWHSLGLDPATAIGAGVATAGGARALGGGLSGYAARSKANALEDVGASLRLRSPLAEQNPQLYGRVPDPTAIARDARDYLAYPLLRQQADEDLNKARVPFRLR